MSADSRLVRQKLKFERDYLLMRNAWARGRRWTGDRGDDGTPQLSLTAIGLLSQLMSHDPNFSVSFRQLERDNVEGDHAIRRAVNELRVAGFLKVEKVRDRGKIVGAVWLLVDPAESIGNQLPIDPDSPRVEKPRAGKPHVGGPHVAEQHGIEVIAREDLPTSERTSSSTRAGDEDALDRLAAVCPATSSSHVFDSADAWCRNCSQVRGDGSIYDLNGNPLREAVRS